MVFNIGDKVKIKGAPAPAFTGIYEVITLAEAADTYTVDVWGDGEGSDFYIDFLEAAQ